MTRGESMALVSILAGFLPIWRSGLRSGLNFYQFIGLHTIFSPYEVSYIPEELLTVGQTAGIYMEIR